MSSSSAKCPTSPLRRPWRSLTRAGLRALPGDTGVFALRPTAGGPVRYGMAGGRSRMGVRGELEACLADVADDELVFTYETTTSYYPRYRELLAAQERAEHPGPGTNGPVTDDRPTDERPTDDQRDA